MSATHHAPVVKPASRRSPNRQRLIARVWVWSIGLSGAAFVIPHFML